MSATGRVFIVGAGPGAPDLITLRGLEAVKRADVLVYDRLVHPSLLEQAPSRALRVYAGRAPGEPGGTRQHDIHQLLIDHARAGRTVVRLKGGDPFVFGRGAEEVLALARAGIHCEVVPGISAAIAAPAAALVPVTCRGVSTAFGVFTGHEATESSGIDWALAAAMPTSVILMGVLHLDAIVSRLIAHGRVPETPAMIIERATLPGQRVIAAQLSDLPGIARGISAPATLVVGEVVRVPQEAEAAIAQSATTAVASISTRARSSSSPATTTSVIAG